MNKWLSASGLISLSLTMSAVVLFTVAANEVGDTPWWFYAGLWLMGISTQVYVLWTTTLLSEPSVTVAYDPVVGPLSKSRTKWGRVRDRVAWRMSNLLLNRLATEQYRRDLNRVIQRGLAYSVRRDEDGK